MREKKKNKIYGVLRTSIVRGTSKEREKEKSKKTTAFGNREMETVKAYLAGEREREREKRRRFRSQMKILIVGR